MSLKAKLIAELTALAQPGALSATAEIRLADPAGLVVLRVAAADRLACAIQSLTLETPRLANAAVDELKELSRDLSQRVSYLLEPIALIECDAESATVQLRSNPPAKDDTQTSYYEILARRGGEISLCRYQKLPGDVRQRIDATLTLEVIARLAQDFVDAV